MLIEFKNDPVPVKGTVNGKGRAKSDICIAIEQMETGKCFYIPYSKSEYNKVSIITSRVGRELDRKFTVRKLHKDQEDIIGVWRIV